MATIVAAMSMSLDGSSPTVMTASSTSSAWYDNGQSRSHHNAEPDLSHAPASPTVCATVQEVGYIMAGRRLLDHTMVGTACIRSVYRSSS